MMNDDNQAEVPFSLHGGVLEVDAQSLEEVAGGGSFIGDVARYFVSGDKGVVGASSFGEYRSARTQLENTKKFGMDGQIVVKDGQNNFQPSQKAINQALASR